MEVGEDALNLVVIKVHVIHMISVFSMVVVLVVLNQDVLPALFMGMINVKYMGVV